MDELIRNWALVNIGSEVTINGVLPVSWWDTSLGLYEENTNYSSSINDGYVVRVTTSTKEYVLHLVGESIKISTVYDRENCDVLEHD